MPDAAMPAGKHAIEFCVDDIEGNVSCRTLEFTVR